MICIYWVRSLNFSGKCLFCTGFYVKLFLCFQVISHECLLYTYWPSRLFSSAFGVFLIFIQFIMPLIILVYCYGRIVWNLSRRIGSYLNSYHSSSHSIASTTETVVNSSSNDKFQLARKNTIKTFLLVGIFFIICWSNNQVYYLMYNLGFEVDWNSTYYQFTVLMVFLNCTINPFIYLAKYRDYQIALMKLFGKEETKSGQESDFIKRSNLSIAGASIDTYI